ncbi:sensor histidine kinase KdpD [Telluribacter sp. SYSU D00476]|uniref:sensor histidine kinase n=1 Tax=Telluribacter sp. SYSU D00476 TaxID=2811430 RepID=UPI001FF66144|nr:HAMP domain-containing sensor histidine kinase [Telluribacter sp. SYSU D00476]
MAATERNEQPAHLASYLFSRREAILNNWRRTCEEDINLPSLRTMSREEFNNLVPLLLDIYELRLQDITKTDDPTMISSQHGLHRWHNGFLFRYLLIEIKYLYQCLADELDRYWQLYPETSATVIKKAYNLLIGIMGETIDGSASRFDELQHLQAASRAANLENAFNRLNELSRERDDILRTSSHDLRGSMSIIQSAAFMLDMEGKSDEERRQLIEMLNRNLQNVQGMLQQLMSLARLDAGQEKLEITTFDASHLLFELVESTTPLADERGIKLLADGPRQLLVTTDEVKIKRIVQNLLLNALHYTPSGVVSVTWATESESRWTLTVQDSGPGLPEGLVSLLVNHLKPPLENTAIFNKEDAKSIDITQTVGYNEYMLKNNPLKTGEGGEGVGLYIVKRLCEMLSATMDVETFPGKGTLFRIRFPLNLHS